MELFTNLRADTSPGLAMALVASSQAPLLLLADDITIVAASMSFCREFGCEPDTVNGTPLAKLGAGEWDVPQLHSLLQATFSGAAINAYEMDLVREGQDWARLVLNALKLDYGDSDEPRVLLTVTDMTAALIAAKLKDDMVQEKEVPPSRAATSRCQQSSDYCLGADAKRTARSVRGDPDTAPQRASSGHVDCDAPKTACHLEPRRRCAAQIFQGPMRQPWCVDD